MALVATDHDLWSCENSAYCLSATINYTVVICGFISAVVIFSLYITVYIYCSINSTSVVRLAFNTKPQYDLEVFLFLFLALQ